MKKLLTPFTDLVYFYLQFGMDYCKWKVWHGSGFGISRQQYVLFRKTQFPKFIQI